jgi:hypothetical protein
MIGTGRTSLVQQGPDNVDGFDCFVARYEFEAEQRREDGRRRVRVS